MTEWKKDFNNQEFIHRMKNLRTNLDTIIQDLKTQKEELDQIKSDIEEIKTL